MKISAEDFFRDDTEGVSPAATLTEKDEKDMIREAVENGEQLVDQIKSLDSLRGPKKYRVFAQDEDDGAYYDVLGVGAQWTKDGEAAAVISIRKANDQRVCNGPDERSAEEGGVDFEGRYGMSESDVAETQKEIESILEDEAAPEDECDKSDAELQMEKCDRIEDDVDEDEDALPESVVRRAAMLSRELW